MRGFCKRQAALARLFRNNFFGKTNFQSIQSFQPNLFVLPKTLFLKGAFSACRLQNRAHRLISSISLIPFSFFHLGADWRSLRLGG